MTSYSWIVGDYGGTLTPLVLNQDNEIVPLTGGAVITFLFEKPEGTIIERIGTTLNTGSDGIAKYTFVAGDLDQAGLWYYWVKITTTTYSLKTDEKKTFFVRED
jgi:hypothetical protein